MLLRSRCLQDRSMNSLTQLTQNTRTFSLLRAHAQGMKLPVYSVLHAARKYQTHQSHQTNATHTPISAHSYGTHRKDLVDGNPKSTSTFFKNIIDNQDVDSESTLYVHWPYCAKRCTYCNFNKYISNSVDHERMKDCLVKEISTLIQRSHTKKIQSIFFGGGTPSLALPSTIRSVISTVEDLVKLEKNAEVTLEVNPTSTEASSLLDFKLAGINRISVGIQTLNEKVLNVLGRQHSVPEALKCLEIAKSIYPGRTSVDLMFGRPGQILSEWKTELNELLRICDDHISLYQLTLERGTSLFKDVNRGALTLPWPEEMADMYSCALDTLEGAGYRRYEASNFSRKGAESVHNQAYWRGSQYIGVGPGAHGRYRLRDRLDIPRWAFTQALEPVPWMVEVERYGHATRRAVPQTTTDILEELLMLGMRTTEGIPEKRWRMRAGDMSLVELFSQDSYVQELIKMNYIKLDESGIRATRTGLNVVDNITVHLIHILQETMGTNEEFL